MESTSHSEKNRELTKTPEYMAFEACYDQLMSLVSEQVNDCARRAFSRALIDTSKLDKIRSSLVTDEAKAAELLREIGQMIRTSVPQAFERFLLILTTDSETSVVQRLTSMAKVYKVVTEFQKLSTSEINLDALAKEFLIKALITPSSYEECLGMHPIRQESAKSVDIVQTIIIGFLLKDAEINTRYTRCIPNS